MITTAERALIHYSPGLPDQCWLWTGRLAKNGYGQFRHNNKSNFAHRVIYELTYGPIPKGLHIDHTCHSNAACTGGPTCVHRACVNPNHLEAVTPAVNAARGAVARARATPGCPHGHDPAEMAPTRRDNRACKACARERSAQVRLDMKAGLRPVKMGTCAGCGTGMVKIMARGLCNACYLRQYRAAKRAA